MSYFELINYNENGEYKLEKILNSILSPIGSAETIEDILRIAIPVRTQIKMENIREEEYDFCNDYDENLEKHFGKKLDDCNFYYNGIRYIIPFSIKLNKILNSSGFIEDETLACSLSPIDDKEYWEKIKTESKNLDYYCYLKEIEEKIKEPIERYDGTNVEEISEKSRNRSFKIPNNGIKIVPLIPSLSNFERYGYWSYVGVYEPIYDACEEIYTKNTGCQKMIYLSPSEKEKEEEEEKKKLSKPLETRLVGTYDISEDGKTMVYNTPSGTYVTRSEEAKNEVISKYQREIMQMKIPFENDIKPLYKHDQLLLEDIFLSDIEYKNKHSNEKEKIKEEKKNLDNERIKIELEQARSELEAARAEIERLKKGNGMTI